MHIYVLICLLSFTFSMFDSITIMFASILCKGIKFVKLWFLL